MTTKKSWKPIMGIVGLILIMMMTAASVSANPITRDNQQADENVTIVYTVENESNEEPMLITTLEAEENTTSNIPDYENYTGDMLISPGPAADSEVNSSLDLPTISIIGSVVVIVVVIVGIIIKRKQ